MKTESELLALAKTFFAKVPSIEPEYKESSPVEVRQGYPAGAPWPEWTRKAGVYYVLDHDRSVLYVGVAASQWGPIYRVEKRIKEGNLPGGTRAGAILFEEPDWYWSLALEAFLIDRTDPPLNKRGKNRRNSK